MKKIQQKQTNQDQVLSLSGCTLQCASVGRSSQQVFPDDVRLNMAETWRTTNKNDSRSFKSKLEISRILSDTSQETCCKSPKQNKTLHISVPNHLRGCYPRASKHVRLKPTTTMELHKKPNGCRTTCFIFSRLGTDSFTPICSQRLGSRV